MDIDDQTAALLVGMPAATIDRRLATERRRHQLKGRSHTKPGSLLKSQIPIRTWAQWDDVVPGFVEIDLVGHEDGNAIGDHAYRLTVTDTATGWTENRSVRNKARKWAIAALDEVAQILPFPLLGVDSDNGSEFINHHLLAWCNARKITFTRSRPGSSNDGAHVEQKNWAIVRMIVGYLRYDTESELVLRGTIWVLQSQLTNYYYPQQKLVSKVRDGAKVSKRYRHRHDSVTDENRRTLDATYTTINPAAVQREIQALTSVLITLATSKHAPSRKGSLTGASSDEATTAREMLTPGNPNGRIVNYGQNQTLVRRGLQSARPSSITGRLCRYRPPAVDEM